MTPRFSAAIRLLAVLLLALAVSPLTAPFSSASPSQLFDQDRPGDGPLVGAWKGPDEPVTALAAHPRLAICRDAVEAAAASIPPGLPRGLAALHQPLRI